MLYCEDSLPLSRFPVDGTGIAPRQMPTCDHCLSDTGTIKAKSAVSLKGIVMDALKEGKYCIVLDHLSRPSYAFAAVVREFRVGEGRR